MSPFPASASSTAEALQSVLLGRRSVRRYLDTSVPEADLQAILELARWAPSPHNSEPWRFAVLRGFEAKDRLARAMADRWRADLGGDGLPGEQIEAELQKSYRRLTSAPVVIVACFCAEGLDEYPDPVRQQNERIMAAQSLGAAVQNVMLAAHARGLATCWMCAPLFCPDVVAEALRLPPGLAPQGLLTLGYPAVQPPPRERRSMDELVIDVE